MKTIRSTGLLLAIILIAGLAHAQTADQIISQYFKNAGGKQNWENLQTVTMQVKMSTNGMEITGNVYSKRPDKLKTVLSVMNKTIISAYDGKDAWMKNPFAPDSSARKVSGEMAQNMKQDFEPEILNYAQKGFSVKLTGSDTLNGKEVYEIQLTKKDSTIEYLYFEKETYLHVMTKSFVASGPQKGTEIDVYQGDFRKVNGLTFPFLMESHVGGKTFQKIEISDIALNRPMDDSFFAFPGK